MNFDLHCHTTASDGALSPGEVVYRAADRGVDVLSITDHDTIDAYGQLDRKHFERLHIVPGIEFSTHWCGHTIHIVGLDIDLDSAVLADAISTQQVARSQRAFEIARRLERAGVEGALVGAQNIAGDRAIGRPHFARFLLESGRVKSIQAAFKKYLGPGKPGDVRDYWPALDVVTNWITAARGVAVIAHPGKYRMTNTKLASLIGAFTDCGGQAIEVLCGQQPSDLTRKLVRLCEQHGLLASCGSDFHMPGQPWSELGAFGALPEQSRPVWESLRI